MNKSSLLLCCIYIILLFICVVNCDISYFGNIGIEDRTPSNQYGSHSRYPDSTSSNICSYSFYYYAFCKQGSTPPSLNIPVGVTLTNVLENSTSAIYKLDYSLVVLPGGISSSVNIQLSFGGCGETEKFGTSIFIACYELQPDSLEISSSEIKRSFLYKDHTILTISGLRYPIQKIDFSDPYQYSYQLSKDTYMVPFTNCNYKNDYPLDNSIINNCSFTINFYNTLKTIYISPGEYINSKINSISEIKTYPDYTQTDTYNQINTYYYSSLVFKLKSDVYEPFKVLAYKSISILSTYYPMYGDSDGITYLYVLDNTSPSGREAVLYHQSGSTSVQATSFTFKQIDYVPIRNTFTYNSLKVDNNLFVFTPSLSNTSVELAPVYYSLNFFAIKGVPYSFPFGFKSGRLNSFNYEADFYCSTIYKQVSFGQLTSISTYTIDRTGIVDTTPPSITNIQVKHIGYSFVRLTFRATDSSGISSLRLFEESSPGYNAETILKEGSLTDGVFELVSSVLNVENSIDTFYVVDVYGNSVKVEKGSFYSVGDYSYQTTTSSDFNGLLNSVTFDSYEMDVSNGTAYNTIYMNFSEPIDYSFYLFIFDGKNGYSNEDYLYPEPSNNNTMFTIKFAINKNFIPGPLEIACSTYSSSYMFTREMLYSKSPQPCIIKSSTPDLSGPLITNIVKLAGDDTVTNLNTNPLATVGWNITIEDKVNGFSHGYIVVQGLVDGSINNFTLNSNNADKSITFTLLLSNMSCVDQVYQIIEVKLYDTNSITSHYLLNKNIQIGYVYTFNPLLYYLGNQDALKVQVSCIPSSIDPTPPILLSITTNTSLINIGSNDRSVSFTLVVRDAESGINIGQSPIVYITSLFFQKVECQSKLLSCIENDIECTYQCEIELPYAFGYPNQLRYQVYGIWNKQGMFSGYSSSSIATVASGIISTEYTPDIPIIQDTNIINNYGGELLVIGRYIGDTELVLVNYSNGTEISITPTYCDYSYCTIQLQGSDLSFTIQLQLKDNSLSNIYNIIPTIVYNSVQSGSSSQDSSSLSSSTEFTCPGQPVCGGSSNGYCSSKGCICISPWYGIECKQKIIVVPQPSLNGTDPNITIILPPNENNNSSNHQIEYTSLTSIISLREIDINKQPIQTHPFSKWFNNQINSTLNEYYSNFTNINNIDKTTQVKVTVQWFNNQTNITFADTQFTINPSSIKYTIEIKDYPFKNKLNSLEIVMSASFKSNTSTKGECSSKEFGSSNGYDNSDYLKLQVNDHSLYSRFIKRGIIEGNKTVPITNTLLDDSFTAVNQASETQSYIGISIPNFDNIAIVDPDFSVMLDYSKSSNSICNKSSRLTSSQIAGIIIGSVGFALVITISAVYYHIKKKRDLKAVQNLSNKLKNIS